MEEVEITIDMLDKARFLARDLGKLNNSILKGKGNLAGFIGEQVALQVLGGTWENTYEYDIVLPDGTRVDVKTKQTSVTPLPEYDCSVAQYNTKQVCDTYAFVRVRGDFTVGWYLGCMEKEKYLREARYLRKGEVDPSNNYTVKADCYNIAIKDLD
tara:strand:+ start:1409 stop:1876 length:468 start_codon:yes stop_codon:yes gene_type:complete